jgi:O-antigen/teichoic acid export membrane protein
MLDHALDEARPDHQMRAASAADITRRTRSAAVFGVAARVFNAGLVFLTQILVARLIGAEGYGVFAVASTWLLLLGGIGNLGTVSLPQRFWPIYRAQGDSERLVGLVRFCQSVPAVLGASLALIAATAAYLAQDLLGTVVAAAILVAMVALPAVIAIQVMEGLALANNWNDLSYGISYGLRPLLMPVMLGVFLLWLPASPETALIAFAAATWLALLIMTLVIDRRLDTVLAPAVPSDERRIWFRAALPVVVIDGAFLLMTSIDLILLSLMRPEADVGVYGAAAKVAGLVAFVHYGLSHASAHHFSDLHARGDTDTLATYARQAARWSFWPSLLLAATLVALAPLIMSLFGRAFAEGAPIVTLLLIGLVARAAIGPSEQLLIMTGHQAQCARVYCVGFLFNLALAPFLIMEWGALGAAMGVTASYSLAALLLWITVRRTLGLSVHAFAAAPNVRRDGDAAAASTGARAMVLTVDTYATCGAAFASLAARAGTSNPSAHPLAVKAAVDAGMVNRTTVRVLAAFDRDDNRLIGVWPLQLGRILPGIRALKAPLVPAYDCNGHPVIEAGREAEVLAAFTDIGRLDWRLPHVIVSRAMLAADPFTVELARTNTALHRVSGWSRAVLRKDNHGDATAYLAATLSARHRKRLAQKRRKLERAGRVEHRIAQDSSSISAAFETFLQIEQAGWKGRRGTAMAALPDASAYMRALLTGLADTRDAAVHSLWVGDQPIAAALLMRSGRCWHFTKTAYDTAYAAFSPGVLLDLHVTESVFQDDGAHMLDTMTDDSIDPDGLIWAERQDMTCAVVNLRRNAGYRAQFAVLGQHARLKLRAWRVDILKR